MASSTAIDAAARTMMARVEEKGSFWPLRSRRIVGRGSGAPGSNSSDHEGRQSSEVGKAAKAILDGSKSPKGQESTPASAPTRKIWAKNVIAAGEDKMSISASKARERGRSKAYLYPNSKFPEKD